MRVVLGGLAHDEPIDDPLRKLRPYADYDFPFPGNALTDIAASALGVAGATPATPVSLSDATEHYLREWKVSGNTARQKHRAAINAAIAQLAGVIVDYDETAGWWQVQDFTFHHKSKFAIRAAAMLRGGVDPGLLDEVVWWRTDDLWLWALDALVIFVRVAAERTNDPIAVVCERIAARHGIVLTASE